MIDKMPGVVNPGRSAECVTQFLHRTLVGRQDARTLLYNIKSSDTDKHLLDHMLWSGRAQVMSQEMISSQSLKTKRTNGCTNFVLTLSIYHVYRFKVHLPTRDGRAYLRAL